MLTRSMALGLVVSGLGAQSRGCPLQWVNGGPAQLGQGLSTVRFLTQAGQGPCARNYLSIKRFASLSESGTGFVQGVQHSATGCSR